MDQIVWAVNPRKDTLPSLLGYIAQDAQEFLEPAGIQCRRRFPEPIPSRPVSPEVRHHLLMSVKEAVRNAVKHASATEITLAAEIDSTSLSITVIDNGSGIRSEPTMEERNGMSNMRDRLQSIGGSVDLSDASSGGTKVSFSVPLHRLAQPATDHSRDEVG
jgi:signal transduction histidine kinase